MYFTDRLSNVWFKGFDLGMRGGSLDEVGIGRDRVNTVEVGRSTNEVFGTLKGTKEIKRG